MLIAWLAGMFYVAWRVGEKKVPWVFAFFCWPFALYLLRHPEKFKF